MARIMLRISVGLWGAVAVPAALMAAGNPGAINAVVGISIPAAAATAATVALWLEGGR